MSSHPLAINCLPTFSLTRSPRDLHQVGPRSPPTTTKLRNMFQILPPPPMSCDLKPAVHTSNSAVTAPLRKYRCHIAAPFLVRFLAHDFQFSLPSLLRHVLRTH